MKTKTPAIPFVLILFLLSPNIFAAAPPNDNFDNAIVISSTLLANPVTGTNLEATKEPGEPVDVAWPPNPRSPLGGKSVWWNLTPTSSGDVTITTAGSGFDTQLGVYTGTTVSNLTEIASNEDAPGATNGFSSVTFAATAGTTYHILVDGYNHAQGAVQLNISGLGGVGTDSQPTVTITSPRPNARLAQPDIILSGKARSRRTNDPIAQVLVQLNGGTVVVADGTTDWQTPLTLVPGDNMVQVRSVTASGTESSEVTREFHFALMTPLTINVVGNGRVAPNLNGKNFEAGGLVRLRATPAKDFLFEGWSGATNSTNPVLTFVMSPNATLTATFVPDPFAGVRGVFNGLILNSNDVRHTTMGFFTVNLSQRVGFSAHFIVGGKRSAASGRFDENGHADFAAGRGSSALTGSLQLDLTNGTDQITGTISGEDFTSGLLGDRAIFNARTNPAPFAGKYNLNFLANEVVHGNGWAMAAVGAGGDIRVAGKLADGRTFSQNVPVSKNGAWPLYVPLYAGNNGAILSWMTFANLPASSVSGLVTWFRPPLPGILFPDGFATRVNAVGSLFITPPRNVPMLNWVNGIAVLGGNDLGTAITNLITFNSNNTITVNFQLAGLKLNVNAQGKLTGSFVDPTTSRTKPLEGVVLPKTNWAGGFFLGTNQSGFIFVGEDLSGGTNAFVLPPSTLDGLTLTFSPEKKTGLFNRLGGGNFAFATTTFTTDATDFSTGTYNFSSTGSSAANVAELNLFGITTHGKKVVIRVLLNFTANNAGNFLAEVTAGGTGVAAGTFSLGGF